MIKLLVSSRFVSQTVVFFVAKVNTDDLIVLKELIEANKVTPIIDRRGRRYAAYTDGGRRHVRAKRASGTAVTPRLTLALTT